MESEDGFEAMCFCSEQPDVGAHERQHLALHAPVVRRGIVDRRAVAVLEEVSPRYRQSDAGVEHAVQVLADAEPALEQERLVGDLRVVERQIDLPAGAEPEPGAGTGLEEPALVRLLPPGIAEPDLEVHAQAELAPGRDALAVGEVVVLDPRIEEDRKSTRLNSSHL